MSKALVVDDSKSARFSVKKLLEKFNIDVDSVASAEDAFSYLESEQPDLILMDHLMPGMDGFDATRRIKQNESWQHIPIIMSTSKSGREYESMVEELGVIGILPKPATWQEINSLLIKADLDGKGKNTATFNEKNGETADKGVWLSVWVDDVDTVHQHCLDQGIEIMHPPEDMPWNVRELHIRHPDGHVFRISQGLEIQ